MSFYSLSLLSVAVVSFWLGISVYYKNINETANRLFLIYALIGASISFSTFMIAGSGDSSSALFWLRTWFLWPFVPVILFRFILSVTDTYNLLLHRIVLFLTIFISFIVSVLYLATDLMIGTMVKTSIGWYHKAPSNSILYFYVALAMVIILYSGFLLIRVYISSTDRRKRQQYILIMMSVLIPVILSSMNYLILTLFDIRIPGLYIYSLFLGLLFIWIGIIKFQLFPTISSVEILLTSIQEALILADSKGTILSANDRMLEISGYMKGELTGKMVSFVITGEFDDNSDTSEDAVLITKNKNEIQMIAFLSRVTNPERDFSGQIYILRKAVNVLKIGEDLVRQKELLRTTLDVFPYPFLIINLEDYTIDIANSAAMKLSAEKQYTCYALSHKFKEPCSGLEHPCPMAEVVRTGKGSIVEHEHYSANGTPLDVEVHAYPLPDKNGKITKMIEYHFDISERKQALAKLKEAKEKAEKSDLAKTEFLGAMSHELRTPLNSVIGFSDMLIMTGTNLSKEQQQYLSFISESGRHLAEIIGSILDYIGMEDMDSDESGTSKQFFRLTEIFEQTLEAVKTEAKRKNLSFDMDIVGGAEFFSVNRNIRKFRIIISNLISNGVKFSSEGETIFITAKIEEDSLSAGIKNTGQKLDYKHLGKIFEPFFQESGGTVNKTSGIGLGLTVVRQLLETLDGSIWVDSRVEDIFTKISFTIPVSNLFKLRSEENS